MENTQMPTNGGASRLGASRSTPSLGRAAMSNPAGAGTRGPLMPAYYSSHKALAECYKRAPGLFAGGGDLEKRTAQNYFPAESRDAGVRSMAYQRRQLLLPEYKYHHRTRGNEAWQQFRTAIDWNEYGGKVDAGASLQTIHKDVR
mmetsp:Transcript_96597/g.167664  ORF Transcript_96597/g.167664 Transcript_96597/m.167664 type:complete len:145 (+) Transcript_96597:99-533(+)